MYKFDICKEKDGVGMTWTSTRIESEKLMEKVGNKIFPLSLSSQFVTRFHRTDGQPLKSKKQATRHDVFHIDLFDALMIPGSDVRVYKTSFSATDRSATQMQQLFVLATSWFHGFDLPEILMSYKYTSEHGVWVPTCAPTLSATLSKIVPTLVREFARSRDAPLTNAKPPSDKPRDRWSLVVGGTFETTYVLVGLRKEKSSNDDDLDEIDRDHPALFGSQSSDLETYRKYHIGALYEKRHRKDPQGTVRLIDAELLCGEAKSDLKSELNGDETDLIDKIVDSVRGALVVAGMVNAFVLELDGVECIQDSLKEIECSLCGAVQRKKEPVLCQDCMQSAFCNRCISAGYLKIPWIAFTGKHNPDACLSNRWSIAIKLE